MFKAYFSTTFAKGVDVKSPQTYKKHFTSPNKIDELHHFVHFIDYIGKY